MAYAVRALWDFSAGNGDELSFLTGDILQVTNSADPDWWEAVDANGNRGLIPANRVSCGLPLCVLTGTGLQAACAAAALRLFGLAGRVS